MNCLCVPKDRIGKFCLTPGECWFWLSGLVTCLYEVASCCPQDHIQEIFGTYGKVKMVDMPVDRLHPHLSKGYAYVEFETADEAEKALKHMDGGDWKPVPEMQKHV